MVLIFSGFYVTEPHWVLGSQQGLAEPILNINEGFGCSTLFDEGSTHKSIFHTNIFFVFKIGVYSIFKISYNLK